MQHFTIASNVAGEKHNAGPGITQTSHIHMMFQVCYSFDTHQLHLEKELYIFIATTRLHIFAFIKTPNKAVQTITRTSASKIEQRPFRLVIVLLIRGQKGYLVFPCCAVSGHNASLFEAQKNTEALQKDHFSNMYHEPNEGYENASITVI